MTLAIGASIQGWTPMQMEPKPLIYEYLQPLPLWPVWVALLLPIMVLFGVVHRLILPWGVDLRGGWWLVQIAYYYLVACALTALGTRLQGR